MLNFFYEAATNTMFYRDRPVKGLQLTKTPLVFCSENLNPFLIEFSDWTQAALFKSRPLATYQLSTLRISLAALRGILTMAASCRENTQNTQFVDNIFHFV